MQRDILLLTEMIGAAEQAQALTRGVPPATWKPIASAATPYCGTLR